VDASGLKILSIRIMDLGGNYLGMAHGHAADGVMINSLATGIRRMPSSTEVSDWSAILDVLVVSEPLSKRRS